MGGVRRDDGRAKNLERTRQFGGTGGRRIHSHRGLNLRLYNPETHKWSLNFASSKTGMLGTPTVGEVKDGRGEFVDQEDFKGQPLLVRLLMAELIAEACNLGL